MVLAATMLAGILSLVRLPSPGQFFPLLELVVEITRNEADARPEPVPEVRPETLPAEPTPQPLQEQPAAEPLTETAAIESLPTPHPPIDWETLRDEAVQAAIDEAEKIYSVNPVFDRARREAAVRFRASVAPDQTFIWDNIEKDQLGRTILRDGSCFKVLDDPSVANRYAFETFDQYMVYCEFSFAQKKGRNLPWVEEIRQRYPYLRDPVEIP